MKKMHMLGITSQFVLRLLTYPTYSPCRKELFKSDLPKERLSDIKVQSSSFYTSYILNLAQRFISSRNLNMCAPSALKLK